MAPTATSQEIATTIAVAGFLFSFSTTVAAIFRTRKQDIHDDRKELRELLERIVAISREKVDAAVKYGYNTGPFLDFDGICNQENTMLSRQAAEIGRRLKTKQESNLFKTGGANKDKRLASRYISATDFYSIGNALYAASNNEEAYEFLQLAVTHALNFNDEVAALKLMATIDFLKGKQEDGRAKYRAAGQIFGKYPGLTQYTQVATNVTTLIGWAFTEANANFFPPAYQLLDQADALVDTLPYSPGAQGFKLRVLQARQQLQQNRSPGPNPFPTPPMPEIAHPRETQ